MSQHLRQQWREARGQSEDYLSKVVEMMATSPVPDGHKYRSVDEIIHARGKPWRNISPTLPPGLSTGPMGNCFGNALNAVLANRSLIYVEGYAYERLFPMQHAWVVDGNGVVYDVTWNPPAADYFGIAFDTQWLSRYVLASGYTSVFGTEFIHEGLIEILRTGLPDAAMNTTGGKA